MRSRTASTALAVLGVLLACTRGELLLDPPPLEGADPLPATAVVEWDHGWLQRLEDAAPDLLAARFPEATVALGALLLGDGTVTTAKVAPLTLSFPAVGMEWMDALGQGVGVRVAYAQAAVDVQVTTEQGVCAARATFAPLWVHVTFAFDPSTGLGALVPVGIPTLVGAEPPTIEPTACAIKLPEGLLADLAGVLQQEVRQRVAAAQLGFVQGLLDELFTPWRATGLRHAAVGADALPLTWWMSVAPGSSAWRREVRVAVEGGTPAKAAPGVAPELELRITAPLARDEGCLVRLSTPVALAGALLLAAAERGLLFDEPLVETGLSERPSWLPPTPGLAVSAPFRVVAAPLAVVGLEVASSAAGVLATASGTWRLRAYGIVEGTELLLGRGLLTGAVRAELAAVDGELRVVTAVVEGSWSDRAAPVVPLAEGWADAALAGWARALLQVELGALFAMVPPAPGPLGAPQLARLTLTDAGLEACYQLAEPPKETP